MGPVGAPVAWAQRNSQPWFIYQQELTVWIAAYNFMLALCSSATL